MPMSGDAERLGQEPLSKESALAILSLIAALHGLSDVKRAGWVREGIPMPESVAKHSFDVGLMAFAVYDDVGGRDLGLTREEFMLAGMLHDLAEVLHGDEIVERGVVVDHTRKVKKDEEEREIMRHLLSRVPQGEELFGLYEKATADPIVARIIKQIERFQMARTALIYELQEPDRDLSEFFNNAGMHLENAPPELQDKFQLLLSLRPQHLTEEVLATARHDPIQFLLEIDQ